MIIAIDGYSSCGKSTLAKAIADHFNYVFIDTGAMYRAVTLYFLQHEIDLDNHNQISGVLDKIFISFENSDNCNQQTILNGVNVSKEIRGSNVTNLVSHVAKLPAVRDKLVAIQRKTAQANSVVMDGRDIGTVVFPEADVKFFVTASVEERTNRRYAELVNKGYSIDKSEVKANLLERDHIDSTRETSPLRKATDAYTIDNTYLNREEQLRLAIYLIEEMKA